MISSREPSEINIRLEKPQLAVMSGVCSAAVLHDFRVLRFVFAEIVSKLYDAETADKIRRLRRLQVASEDLRSCRN